MELYSQLLTVDCLVECTRIVRILCVAPFIQLPTQFLIEKNRPKEGTVDSFGKLAIQLLLSRLLVGKYKFFL